MKYNAKTLLVDLDGTLLGAYNFLAHARFIRKTLWHLRKQNGWSNSLKAMNALQKTFSMKKFTVDKTNADKATNAIAQALKMPFEQSEKVLVDMMSVVFPSLKLYFYPIKGAREFLDWAHKRYPLILATNPVWPQEIIEMRVRWAGIDPAIFKSITHAKKMHSCKPDLQYYQEILSQEGMQPQDCLLIGNDMKNDYPAVKAGIAVYIVGKKSGIHPIQVENGSAPAWHGDFKSLQELLST